MALVPGTTLEMLQAGSARTKWVVAIEGYKYLLTDAVPARAVEAWAGTDWQLALDGLFVELANSQRIDPYDPFTPGGTCKLSVVDTNYPVDQFGIDVYRRAAGAETVLTASIGRADTVIPVGATASFAAATSELHIGTECIEYSSKTSSTFTASKRGKYSPFAAGGTGAPRFANHHRVAYDKNHVLLNPVVSQEPRIWLGRRVGVWMHKVDADGNLNSRADAQLVYAGVIVSIADDANTMCTRLELKNILDIVQDSTLGRDIYGGEIGEGLYLQVGRKFLFEDFIMGVGLKAANELAVVAGTPASANQVQAGYYTGEQICAILNQWLGAEKDAGRIHGRYTWCTGVPSNVGLRTKCYWNITHGSDVFCTMLLSLPGEVSAFLGLRDVIGSERGQTVGVGMDGRTNRNPHNLLQGDAVPFSVLVFKPAGPAIAQEFTEAIYYKMQNERGVFVDQYGSLPAALSPTVQLGYQWGVFLLDEKQLIVAAYDQAEHAIKNAWIAPWRVSTDENASAMKYIGRRIDEPAQGPVTIRQVYVLTGTLQSILNRLFYGSGTSGYNHATYDTFGPGLGVGIPGELLGTEFERSIANLPGAQADLAVIFDEATTLPDLIASDLMLRRASLRWFNEHLEFVTWQTPAGSLSRATLTDANKAAPATSVENHRAPTLETTVFQRALVKIDYDREHALGRNGDYRKSIQVEDQVAVDDSGGETRPLTIKARNTFSDFSQTGAAIEEITKGYLATMPSFSRAARHIPRSIDQRYWETLGVGDIVTVEDKFARDPATGKRGVNSRYGTIVSIGYNPGGREPGQDPDNVRQMTGEVEIRIPDVNRYLPYGPGARVDETQANGGYNAGTKTLTCYAHKYSEASEPADASHFPAGYRVKVVEVDPADPATAKTWDDIVAAQAGNAITLTAGIAGWDATKRYRVVFDTYLDCVTAQRDFAFQADATDRMVQDAEVAYHYSATNETIDTTANTGTEKAVFHADALFGDGASLDAGSDADLANLINQLIDRKTAHQMPMYYTSPIGFVVPGSWSVAYLTPVFFGSDQMSSGVMRSVTVAPFLRKSGAGPGYVRVTLSRQMPMSKPGSVGGTALVDVRFGDVFSSALWEATSTTFSVGPDKTLALHAKDLASGFAWLTVELYDASIRGLAKCIEGKRIAT